MKTHHFNIEKQARHTTLGNEDGKISKLWIVLHGYGQLATYFIRNFEAINDGETLVVAPEGMNRFYLKGFSGRVGATWMTKEDRLTDIANNNLYLDRLIAYYRTQYPEAAVTLLGFSQGAATAVRWVCQAKSLPARLILWSGSFPEDLNWFEDIPTLNRLNPTFVLGDEDEFFDEARIAEYTQWLIDKGLQFDVVRFQGGHIIPANTLKSIYHSR